MEVGMLSGMFSDMAMEQQILAGMRRRRRETRVVSLWSRSLVGLVVQTRNGCVEVVGGFVSRINGKRERGCYLELGKCRLVCPLSPTVPSYPRPLPFDAIRQFPR